MGIKHLWTVLAPFCDRKPLYELQGKTIAVDLSCWVCEAQNIAEYQVQPRMYLRNLYFRTCYLLLMDVNPVFVLEGKAPELKYDTISARNAIQFKGAKPKCDGVKTGKDRTRFHFILRQCEEMLRYMGVACIKGNGEAESLCAYLNEDGLVDGCISQDSDCFAYGAKVVYRNFSISTQGAQAASGGAVDVYDIRKASYPTSFGRNKIIAMALLIGCDYSEGVQGIGKDSVLKFFETVSEDEVLNKLRLWRRNKDMYENFEKQLANKNICTSCGHNGRIQNHTKNGCSECTTSKGCDPFKYKTERLNIKNEVNMRNRAIKDPNFPNEILIREFLDRKDDVKELDLEWKQPNVVRFLKFTTKFLQWEELYAFEKILPVLTRWQCRNPESVKRGDKFRGVLEPDKIKKVRNPKGVPSYEIIWSDPGEHFKGLVPESQITEHNVDLEKLWSTIEPQNLVESAYPKLVKSFRHSKVKPKKVSKRKKKPNDCINEIADKLINVSLSEPTSKKTRKPKPKRVASAIQPVEQQLTIENLKPNVDDLNVSFEQMTIKQQKKVTKTKTKTLDDFVKKAVINSYKQKSQGELLTATSSTPAKANADLSFDLDISSFDDENDLELSEIIDDIVSRNDLKYSLKRVADEYVQGLEKSNDVICLDEDGFAVSQQCRNVKKTTRRQTAKSECSAFESGNRGDHLDKEVDFNNPPSVSDDDLEGDRNHVSSFFVSDLPEENDVFEKTFNDVFRNFQDSGGSDTEEYEYEKKNCFSRKDDDYYSFDDNYVPLCERLKNKNK